MSSSSKRQTMAKMTRERALKERRELKQQRKDQKKLAASAEATAGGASSALLDETGSTVVDALAPPGFPVPEGGAEPAPG